jgi:hypothetical protein
MAFVDTRTPNIRLKAGKSPITVMGKANNGNILESLRFPSEEAQKTGWHSKHPQKIVAAYPDRYEIINGGEVMKWQKAGV